MEFKFRMDTLFKSGLSAEERAEAEKALELHMKGVKQQMIGDARKDVADKFLALINPKVVPQVEAEISKLQAIQNPDKFRHTALGLLAEAYFGGFMFGLEIKNEAGKENMSIEEFLNKKHADWDKSTG